MNNMNQQQLPAKAIAHEETSRETVRGTIERIVFQNNETGFVVFVLTTSEGTITTIGTFPQVGPGQEVQLTGTWRMHKKFGKQFEAQSCINILPTTVIGLKKYLGSGLIKGIGESYADKLVDRFGIQILNIIDKQPQRLSEISGIGPKRIEQITTAWKDQKEVAAVMVFLQEKGISPGYAAKIYKQYRERAIQVLQDNPYRLAEDIWGISFKIADQIAQNMGIHVHAPHRIHAGILFCIAEATKQGHLYVVHDKLCEMTKDILGLEAEHLSLVIAAIQGLHDQGKAIILEELEQRYVTLPSYYHSERGIAERIAALKAYQSPFLFEYDAVQQLLHKQTSLMLNADQQQGIITCLTNKVTIITGGPGTGKTTLIKQLLGILDHHQVEFKLSAPTGRAAKRITESTGRYATTLHRLLEFDMSIMSFKHHDKNPLKTHFLIVDEASMIDIFLAYALLKALPVSAHIIFLGDSDQLPSVGAGNFFRDCIMSQTVSVVRLTEIFRQAQDSLIVANAHRVNNGEFPTMSGPKRDFIFIKEEDPEQLAIHLKRILFAELPRHYIDPSQAIVLTPMNRGVAGTQMLNSLLQELLNPKSADTIMYAGTPYKIDDKVMQIRNNYEKMVFNGDIGIIKTINHEDSFFEVIFDERCIRYEFDEINELTLAYAITIHKSQGSEYPAVIIPLFMQHFMLLQRNLVYTAITRAKKLCIMIGQPKALAMALKNNKSIARLTFLQKFLR